MTMRRKMMTITMAMTMVTVTVLVTVTMVTTIARKREDGDSDDHGAWLQFASLRWRSHQHLQSRDQQLRGGPGSRALTKPPG